LSWNPVIVSSSGDPLLDDEGVMALKKELVGRAHAVTPNIPEAEVLSGVSILQRTGPARGPPVVFSTWGRSMW
jgi:hydroxymethylpyrimidine/phosphomethylpyrimidine kinase